MKTVIDWSKAPEGTTHKFSEPTTSPWRDLSGPTWKWWSDEDGWKDSRSSTSALLKRQSHRLTVIEHPVWTGEGLPPVGTVCEFEMALAGWVPATITAVTQKSIVFTRPLFKERTGLDYENTHEEMLPHHAAKRFRPIRTPEQIAAEEREKAVMELKHVIAPYLDNVHTCAYALYDVGYRKQVQL